MTLNEKEFYMEKKGQKRRIKFFHILFYRNVFDKIVNIFDNL